MLINFYKYHGAGNDFIIINNYNLSSIRPLTAKIIQKMCDRHFGIGADGLMIIEKAPNCDFDMRYFNADGKEGTMCGNGGRCLVAFANEHKIIGNNAIFRAIDGIHEAQVLPNNLISIKINNVGKITKVKDAYLVDTGSPHYIEIVSDLNNKDVFNDGREIRNKEQFQPKGVNVNFITINTNSLKIRTFERGVEDETLACGTGSVAAAIISKLHAKNGKYSIKIETLGGILEVSFEKFDTNFNNVYLTGPAKFVFKGQYAIS